MTTKRDPINTDEFYRLQKMDAVETALESLREQDERDEEEAEEETLEDRESRARLALIYAEDHATKVPTLPFREWVREQLRREGTPEHDRAWEDEPIPNMSSWQRAQRGE